MTTSVTGKIDGSRHRRLQYGDIWLVPADADSWHMPGQTIVTTQQLVSLATKRGIKVWLVESSRDGQTTALLN